MLKQRATIEGLTLLVGSFSKKLDDARLDSLKDDIFVEVEEIVMDAIGEKNKTLYRSIDGVNRNAERVSSEMAELKTQMTGKFLKIQQNFNYLDKVITDSQGENSEFRQAVIEKVDTLHDAIFVPMDSDDDTDSDYVSDISTG